MQPREDNLPKPRDVSPLVTWIGLIDEERYTVRNFIAGHEIVVIGTIPDTIEAMRQFATKYDGQHTAKKEFLCSCVLCGRVEAAMKQGETCL